MAKSTNFKIDPKLAELLGETYKSVEDAIKEVLDSPERYYHYSNNALSSSYQYIRN